MSQTTISPPNPYMDAAIYERLAHRYAPVLDKARTFLGKKGTTKNGGTISALRKKTLEENEADCPHCGLRFRRQNHNTEHIHPKALGGGKSDKNNRIQMCKMCNNARGSTMLAFMGDAPYTKHYPSNWQQAEAYLLWSELTVDEGLSAGAQIPEVHELFIEARFAGEMPLSAQPKYAYGRFSTWSAGDAPNYPGNQPVSHQGSWVALQTGPAREGGEPSPTIGSVVARMTRNLFDWVFDYRTDDSDEGKKDVLGEKMDDSTASTFEVADLQGAWKTTLDGQFSQRQGSVPLGMFWDMVAFERERRGLAWRAYERLLGITHRGSMPAKASQLLEQMNYSFVFKKTEEGYLISLAGEEE